MNKKNILVSMIFLIVACKKKSEYKSSIYNFEETVNGIEITKKNGEKVGTISFNDSQNIIYKPAFKKYIRVLLDEDGVSVIGSFFDGKPIGKMIFFDKNSLPYSIKWFNDFGILYSEVENIEVESGFIHPSLINNIDSNEITTPEIFIKEVYGSKEKYKLIVFSNSYPIYLIGFYYNLTTDNIGKYDFLGNSFTLKFDKKDMLSDTLKLELRYYYDFESQEEKKIIETQNFDVSIDGSVTLQ